MAEPKGRNSLAFGNIPAVVSAGNWIHETSEKCLDNEKLQLRLTLILSFISVFAILSYMWPIRGATMAFCTVFVIAVALCIVILITKCGYINVMIKLSEITKPYAQQCRKKNSVHTSKRKQMAEDISKDANTRAGKLGSGPKAEVSIRYFIEVEKSRSVYNARYIGRA